MVEVGIFTIVVSGPGIPSVVVLAQKDSIASIMDDSVAASLAPQVLPIWIGHSEAEAIMLLLGDKPHPRPLTYDLLANVVGMLGSKVEHVVIDRVEESTFYATINLTRDGRPIQVDARPSDSIALAVCTGAQIFVDEDVMNAAAHPLRVKLSDAGELLYGTEDEVDRFHSFIETLSPEDFTL